MRQGPLRRGFGRLPAANESARGLTLNQLHEPRPASRLHPDDEDAYDRRLPGQTQTDQQTKEAGQDNQRISRQGGGTQNRAANGSLKLVAQVEHQND